MILWSVPTFIIPIIGEKKFLDKRSKNDPTLKEMLKYVIKDTQCNNEDTFVIMDENWNFSKDSGNFNLTIFRQDPWGDK